MPIDMDKDGGNAPVGAREISGFWVEITLDDLIEQQHSQPVAIDALSVLWPDGVDPDELMGFIRRERAERRRTALRNG